MKVIYLLKRRICLKTTSTMTLLKNIIYLELYLHELVSVWQIYGHNIMFMCLIFTVVIAIVFMIQTERQFC